VLTIHGLLKCLWSFVIVSSGYCKLGLLKKLKGFRPITQLTGQEGCLNRIVLGSCFGNNNDLTPFHAGLRTLSP
jgi:hypothetical protein